LAIVSLTQPPSSRTVYSDIDSVKLAYEGLFYYKDWANVIGVEDPLGLADFRECPGVVLQWCVADFVSHAAG
jgi:hypothetical protein